MTTFEESFTNRWGEVDAETLAHDRAPYDPVKAHEYYMRTRKLKGKQKRKPVPEEVKREYQDKLGKFLGSLPMAKKGTDDGGKSLKETAKFVNRMRTMKDEDMVKEAKALMTPKPGEKNVSQEAMGKMKTINALLQNRSRVRAANGTGPKKRVTTKVWEDGSTSKVAINAKAPKGKRVTAVPKKKAPAPKPKAPPKPRISFAAKPAARSSTKPNHAFPKPTRIADVAKLTTTQKLTRLAAKKEREKRARLAGVS